MKKHTNVITLPKYLEAIQKRKYITQSGDMWQPETAALCFALAIRTHGTVEAVRATARRLAPKVCMEQQARMRALSRRPTNELEHRLRPSVKLNGVRDEDVLQVATNIINRVCDLVGIDAGVPFEPLPLIDPPRCHYKPMRLAGEPGARNWKCQHCSHTKPITLDTDAAHAADRRAHC